MPARTCTKERQLANKLYLQSLSWHAAKPPFWVLGCMTFPSTESNFCIEENTEHLQLNILSLEMSPVVSSLRTAGQQHDVAGFISEDNRMITRFRIESRERVFALFPTNAIQ